MSTLSTSIYGSSTSKGFGGLVSGLDTDDLVNQMLSNTKSKINREYQSKQKLLYRQQAYREISTKLLSFSDKYFSYSSGSDTNILSSKFFESYTYESSSSYVNVTGDAENIANFSIDSISSVATAANFASNKKVTSGTFASEAITANTSTLAGATMTFEYDGESYSLAIDKGFGNDDTDIVSFNDVLSELNEQLLKTSDLSKVTASFDASNKLVISSSDGKEVKLTAASNSIIENLNMTLGQTAVSSAPVEVSDLTKETASILTSEDSYITFDFNGVQKTINLDSSVTKDNLSTYLQNELDDAYGAGKVTVADVDNKLTFSAVDDSTNIFGVSGISTDLGNFTGIESGDYNRLNKTRSIAESGIAGIGAVATTTLSNGKEGYIININNVDVEIESTMTVTEAINKINSNAEAGVEVYYSSTTNTFSVKASETGEHKGVSISAGAGTLAQALFGTGVDLNEILETTGEYIKTEDGIQNIYKKEANGTETKLGKIVYDKETRIYTKDYDDDLVTDVDIATADYHINAGTNTEMTYTLNGVQNTINRSTANFTIDEINIELNEKAEGLQLTDTPITFDVTNNSDEVVEKFKGFIDSYNEIITLINTKTSEKPDRDYQPLTPEQQEEMEEDEIKDWETQAKKGVLFGDSKMNIILRNMRETMSSMTSVSSLSLSSIGVSSATMDTSGKLILDEEKFKEKLLENPDEIASLFSQTTSDTSSTAKSGLAVQLRETLIANVGAYGTTGILIDEAGLEGGLTSDQNYISEKMEEYEDKMEELKDKMEDERERYWSKFSNLETTLNNLNSQSSWLTDMLG
ncbi:MAG: flagellar filament capping protein FliD [Sedimentibacter sp.]|uniref:flagellar filament capping protein FliD n=1 Tax=Sedimentibacter sp. TaxID=1960295 RepID=UPI002980C6DF|nr:flagellar filament capping protein FliD [Sedimentibacter sp.]MDW5300032.1 flagellar filament capping protein FliD [Sedimentibacter sp.]